MDMYRVIEATEASIDLQVESALCFMVYAVISFEMHYGMKRHFRLLTTRIVFIVRCLCFSGHRYVVQESSSGCMAAFGGKRCWKIGRFEKLVCFLLLHYFDFYCKPQKSDLLFL